MCERVCLQIEVRGREKCPEEGLVSLGSVFVHAFAGAGLLFAFKIE